MRRIAPSRLPVWTLNFLDRFHHRLVGVVVIRLFIMLIPSSVMLFWISRVPGADKILAGWRARG